MTWPYIRFTDADRVLAIKNAQILKDQMKLPNGTIPNSVKQGRGNVSSQLGEIAVARHLGAVYNGVSGTDKYHYDILYGDIKVEVKTKECTTEPRDYFNAAVFCSNTRQECDVYIFTRVLNQKCCWLMGFQWKGEYLQQARLKKKGELDPESPFGWKFPEACLIVPYNEIRPIEELTQIKPTKQIKFNFEALMTDTDDLPALDPDVDLPALDPTFELAASGNGDVLDWRKEWQGMPEFVQQDLSSFRSIKVHFRNQPDVDAFAQLLGQKISPKQKALWYPEWEPRRYAHKRYVDESPPDDAPQNYKT